MAAMTEADMLAFVVVIATVLLFAVVSNVLVIVSVTSFRKLRTVTNVLIGNLAVSDILLDGIYMPQKLHDLTHTDNYHEGLAVCKFIHFTPIFLITSSCYTLVAISFERRRAIVHSNKRQVTLTHIRKVIVAIWIFSFIVSLPTLFEFSLDETYVKTDDNVTNVNIQCGHGNTTYSFVVADGIFVLVVSFLIPLILVFYNYIRLVRFIAKRGRVVCTSGVSTVSGKVIAQGQGQVQGQGLARPVPQLCRYRARLINMLVLVAAMFAFSWAPFFAIFIYMKISGSDASKYDGSAAGLLLIAMATFSTAYNAVLYVVFNSNFREAFRSILKCNWRESPGRTTTIIG